PESEAKLHEAHPALDESSCQQTVRAELAGGRFIEAVELANVLRLVGGIENFRRGRLHAIGELIAANPCVQFALQRIFVLMDLVVGRNEIELLAAVVQRVIGRQREIWNAPILDARALISRGKESG